MDIYDVRYRREFECVYFLLHPTPSILKLKLISDFIWKNIRTKTEIELLFILLETEAIHLFIHTPDTFISNDFDIDEKFVRTFNQMLVQQFDYFIVQDKNRF
jgi:hypothetical protein